MVLFIRERIICNLYYFCDLEIDMTHKIYRNLVIITINLADHPTYNIGLFGKVQS
jgi:hypothetical protein